MAAALLNHALSAKGCPDVEVISRGIRASLGYAPTPATIKVLTAHGIDISSHRSHPLDPGELDLADLVIAMGDEHAKEVLAVAPHTPVMLLRALTSVQFHAGLGSSKRARLHTLLAAPILPQHHIDVTDPVGGPPWEYEQCMVEMQRGIDALVRVLCGSTRSPFED